MSDLSYDVVSHLILPSLEAAEIQAFARLSKHYRRCVRWYLQKNPHKIEELHLCMIEDVFMNPSIRDDLEQRIHIHIIRKLTMLPVRILRFTICVDYPTYTIDMFVKIFLSGNDLINIRRSTTQYYHEDYQKEYNCLCRWSIYPNQPQTILTVEKKATTSDEDTIVCRDLRHIIEDTFNKFLRWHRVDPTFVDKKTDDTPHDETDDIGSCILDL